MRNRRQIPIEGLLQFSGPLAIVGGGPVDEVLLVELSKAGVSMIGADSGSQRIADAGLLPAAIVGDLDSLFGIEEWKAKSRVIQVDDQDTTDFQKCLEYSRAPVTIGVGLTGGRFDHTLATLSAVAEYAADRRIVLVDEQDIVVGVHGGFRFTVSPGDRVSVYPMVPMEFAGSEGLEFSLDGLRLEPGGRVGTSNVAIDGPFRIEPRPVTPGPWLLVLNKRYLWDVIG